MAAQKSENSSDLISLAADDGRNRESFFSFGDKGLTASVSSSGRLLRITQHFPGQRTGFCVDPKETPEPYFTTWRMNWFLLQAAFEHFGGIGPSLKSLCPDTIAAPAHKIINGRWPTFSRSSAEVKLEVGYVASAGTIYQKFDFFYMDGHIKDKKLFEDEVLTALSLESDFLIRDLDFVKRHNEFNVASARDIVHGNLHNTDLDNTAKNHITRKHKSRDRELILHVHVLSKDSSIEFFKTSNSTGAGEHGKSAEYSESNSLGEPSKSANPDHEPSYGIRRRRENSGTLLEDHPQGSALKFVLAYTLGQAPAPRSSLPTWETFCNADGLLKPREDKVDLSNNPSLDFFLKRNLEYILSVCSIPVLQTVNDDDPAIALTCGDVECHRITTAASFHAFQFLLLALDHFTSLHTPTCNCGTENLSSATGPYVCTMKRRIEQVCKGHIKWVFQRTRSSVGISCPNYWTNGEEIEEWESSEWLPGRSLVDAPFQLIKAGDLHSRLTKTGQSLSSDDMDGARRAFKHWIEDLKDIDKLDFSAFPSYKKRAARVPSETFYLTDHALVWRALKSAESMGLNSEFDEHEKEKFSAKTLREKMLQRFTTENPLLKKRMIALKRSPTRTRFLLRSKDSLLFHAMEEGLFFKFDIWNNTINCQQHHEGNDDTKWDDPRRFALSIVMDRHKNPINLRPRREMLQHAVSVLLRSSSANGLFAGKLDENQSPVIYDGERMRDDYWAVVFEVPYLLWKYYCSETVKDDANNDSELGSENLHGRLDSICHSVDHIQKLLGDVVVQQAQSAGQRHRHGYWMKHDLPFNNMIDEDNIVELQDEWLYNTPSFFAHDSDDDIASTSDETDSDTPIGAEEDNDTPIRYIGLMVDVPDLKSLKNEGKTNDLEFHCFPTVETRVKTIMGIDRTAKAAKKRFWAFISESPFGNAECVETVPSKEVREKAEIRRFLRRHKSCDNFFTEQTEPLLNMWTTEFHLSFPSRCIRKRETGHLKKGSTESPAQKVAMGFRFEGDFFDRYWTCRYVEADAQRLGNDDVVQEMIKFLELEDLTMDQKQEDGIVSARREQGNANNRHLKVGPWQQRRVLELMLFGRVIRRMNRCAKEIFKSAEIIVDAEKKQLRRRLELLDNLEQKTSQEISGPTKTSEPAQKDPNSASRSRNSTNDKYIANKGDTFKELPIDYRSFLVTSRQLQDFQNDLQEVVADFMENKAKIDLWLGREEDRQAERPRWTFNDESRYRAVLSKLLVKNSRSIQDLKRNQGRIASLSESITKELELVRSHLEIMLSDEEQRRAEDIKLFTYVTAIFLPLGFATGIFSMSGAPDGKTFGSMAGTAVGVLLLGTLILLVVTKKIKFQHRLRWPSATAQSSPPPKESMDERRTSGEGRARDRSNAARAANTTVLPRSNSTTAVMSGFKERRKERDPEVGECDNTAMVGRTQSYEY